jgi:pantoate--beta-alanine ligase
MSSRNLRLLPEHRTEAPIVSAALRAGIEAIDAGERDPATVEAIIRAKIATASHAEEPDYVAVVDADSLLVPDVLAGDIRLLTAVRFGEVRLIDNMGTTVPDGASA